MGDGRKINLWHDRWLSYSIVSLLNINDLSMNFNSSVSALICDGAWCIPVHFQSSFPQLVLDIKNTKIPFVDTEDKMVWCHSVDDDLTLAEAYHFSLGNRVVCPWNKFLWSSFIPPKYSMFAWRLFYNIVPTDDQLRLCGLCVVSTCPFCL